MASAAQLSFLKAVNKAHVAGSNERKALTKFAVDGININQDREAARWVVKGWPAVLTAIKQTWGL